MQTQNLIFYLQHYLEPLWYLNFPLNRMFEVLKSPQNHREREFMLYHLSITATLRGKQV